MQVYRVLHCSCHSLGVLCTLLATSTVSVLSSSPVLPRSSSDEDLPLPLPLPPVLSAGLRVPGGAEDTVGPVRV